MGNIASEPVGLSPAPIVDITTFVAIGSDPDEIRDQLMAHFMVPGALAPQDISLGGAGQGGKFCVAVTGSPVPFTALALRLYMASSPDELGNAFNKALAQLIADADGNPADFLGHTVVGSSDGGRFCGCLFARQSP